MSRWSVFFFSVFGLCIPWACVHFWLDLYSGTEIADEQVFLLDEKLTHRQRAASQFRRDPANYRPVAVSLEPEMNSVGIYFSYEMRKSRSGQGKLTVELISSSGEIVQEIPVQTRVTSGSSSGTGSNVGSTWKLSRVGKFEVTTADEYQVRVIPDEKRVTPFTKLRVSLRRNVISPPIENFFAAIFTAIVAMGCGIVSVVARQQTRMSQAARVAAQANAEQDADPESE